MQFYSAEWACDQGRSGMNCRDAPTVCRTGARAATWAFSKYYDVFAPTGGTCDFSGTAYMSDSLPYPECVYGLVPEPTRRPTPRPIQPNRNQPIPEQPIPDEQPIPNEQPTSRPTPPIGTIADRVHCIPDPSDDPIMTNYAVEFVCGSLSDMDCDDAPFNCRADDKAATWAFSKYYETVQMKRLEERVNLLGTGAAELDSSVQQMRAECMLETAILSNKLPYPECVYGLVNPNGSGESNGSGGDPDATDETEDTPAEETAPRPEATTPSGCGDCGEGGFCNFDVPSSFCERCPSDFQTCRTDGLPELGALDCLAQCSEFIRIPAPGNTATARTQSDEDKETKVLGLPVNTFIIIVAVVSTLILGCCAVLLVCAFCGPSERDGRNDEYFIPKERTRTKRRRRGRRSSLSYDRSDDARSHDDRSDDDRDGRKLERARV